MSICGSVEPEIFQGNSVQMKLGIWACVSRASRAREIVWEGFNVMAIKQATRLSNFDQRGIEPVLMMVKSQGSSFVVTNMATPRPYFSSSLL